MKKGCPYVLIILLTPGRYDIKKLGRFPDLPGKRPSRPCTGQWCKNAFLRNGLNSSGHCSGFSPDSLLYDNRKLPYHQSGDKVRKLFKIRGILYYLN